MELNRTSYILIGILLLMSLSIHFIRPVWMEPDSTAFFNRTCLNGKDFDTPIISRTIFSIIPCHEFVWKIFHVLLMFASVSALYYFCKKLNLGSQWFLFSFLSYFILIFLLQLEDDQIAFPLIVVLSARLIAQPTWSKRLGYCLAILFLTFTVWSGAYVPMLLILVWTIHPWIGTLIPIAYLVYHFLISGNWFFSDPGGTQELVPGYGFLTNDIPLLLLLFVKDKRKKIKENWNLFGLFTSFNLLSFIYPKLAYYSVIPLLLIGQKMFDDNQKHLLILAGLIALVMAPGLISFNANPNDHTWKVIDEAVEFQEKGNLVYNDWWVGRWFHYRGGHASAEGGNPGPQTFSDQNYYWLGSNREDCNTLNKSGVLRLQFCSALPVSIASSCNPRQI